MTLPYEQAADAEEAADAHGRPKGEGAEEQKAWKRFLKIFPKWARTAGKAVRTHLGQPSNEEHAANATETLERAANLAGEAEARGIDNAVKANEELTRIFADEELSADAKRLQLEVLADAVPALRRIIDQILEAHEELRLDGGEILGIETARAGQAAKPLLSPDDSWEFYNDKAGFWRWRRRGLDGEIIDHPHRGWSDRAECEDDARLHGWDG